MRRLTLGLSQSALGDTIGVTFQQVQKYENGTNRLSASKLQRVANALQVPVPFFFEGQSGKASLPSFITEFLASSDGIALARTFVRITSRKQRRAIVNVVARLSEK